MKRNLLTLILLSAVYAAYAQPAAGLIAHWDMNGTTNDVSGNGHNGTGHNLTPDIGEDGVLGQGWAFNGVNSSITIPYFPELNVSGYTIATTFIIKGFYNGDCHQNTIFCRGPLNAPGGYYLQFNDLPSGNTCSAPVDTNQESFITAASSATTSLAGSSLTPYNYYPYIFEYQWYTVVATFNDTIFKIYVNNVLEVSFYSPTPGVPVGMSTDSASIGYDIYDAASGNSHAFNGVIDDVLLYNRALSDSEVIHINDPCGSITSQPVSSGPDAGGTVTYTIGTSITGAVYQWQENSGAAFANLYNTGQYSGVNTSTLTIMGVTPAMNNYTYRCLVSNSWGCAFTSFPASLTLGVNNIPNNSNDIEIYPNPASTQLTILSTYQPINKIAISNLLGQTMYSNQYNAPQVQVDIAALPAGVYFVKVNGVDVTKFVKE